MRSFRGVKLPSNIIKLTTGKIVVLLLAALAVAYALGGGGAGPYSGGPLVTSGGSSITGTQIQVTSIPSNTGGVISPVSVTSSSGKITVVGLVQVKDCPTALPPPPGAMCAYYLTTSNGAVYGLVFTWNQIRPLSSRAVQVTGTWQKSLAGYPNGDIVVESWQYA